MSTSRWNIAACGVSVSMYHRWEGGLKRKNSFSVSIPAGSSSKTISKSIAGGAGGAGGSGGSGCAGGKGQSFNTAVEGRTSCSNGGAVGSQGSVNSFKTPDGKVLYGNRGGSGCKGGSGGYGGAGGNWGKQGATGGAGARGGCYGGYGGAGARGQSSGNSIVGWTYLLQGSKVGNISGSIDSSLVNIKSINEVSPGTCEYLPSDTCAAESTYDVTYTGIYKSITWIVTGATLVSGQGTENIVVSTTDSKDNEFTVKVSMNNTSGTSTITRTFTHVRTEIVDPVDVSSVVAGTAGTCQYLTGSTCKAHTIYTATASDYDSLVWTVDGGAYITAGQGTTQVTVETDNNATDTFNVTCTATGAIGGTSSKTIPGTHTRTENPDTVNITSISSGTAGSCVYPIGGTCEASTVFNVVAVDYDTLTWTVNNGATITSGQGTDYITVSTTDNVTDTFEVTCTAAGLLGGTSVKTISGGHSRTEEADPVFIEKLTEGSVGSGSCSYETGSTCTASSTYSVSADNYDTLTWSIVGSATITAGQGTDYITVESTGNADINFTLTCVAKGLSGLEVQVQGSFMHTRTENVLTAVTYDSTNISTEFIS